MTESTADTLPSDPTEPISEADERLQVLRLLESGEITADEADLLLDALDAAPSPPAAADPAADHSQEGPKRESENGKRRAPQLRIRVSEAGGKARVNLTLPLGFLDAGLRLARRLAPGHIPNQSSLESALNSGFRGHLIDVEEGGEHVEILIE